ncbi:MAG: sugar transferase [Bacteroidota bacterium]
MKFSDTGIKTKLSPSILQLIADVFAIIISFAIHYYLRFETGLFGTRISPEISTTIVSALLLLGYWLLLFGFSGLYKNWYVRSPFDEMFTVIRVAFFGTFIIFFLVFLDSQSSKLRLLFLLYFAIFACTLVIGRLIARNLQKRLRAKRYYRIPSIIVGTAKEVKSICSKFLKAPSWGYLPKGVILTNNEELEKWYVLNQSESNPVTSLGIIDDFNLIISENHPKEIIITVEKPEHTFLLEIAAKCAELNIPVKIVPDLYDFFTGQARTMHLYGIPLIEINTQLLKPWEEFIKRTTDITFSFLGLFIGLPLWTFVGIIIKLESPGPVFFKQDRVGKNGKVFKIVKFRSMVKDADKGKPSWTSVGDSRVTKFGKFTRSSHLDEIPQLWNVLKGDMSLVGPRPEQQFFVEKYSNIVPYYTRRHVVRPGITGWWQVKYTTYEESTEEIESRLKDDFYYIENISLRLDFEIMVRTVFKMLVGHGQT